MNREAELDRPSRVACSDLLADVIIHSPNILVTGTPGCNNAIGQVNLKACKRKSLKN